MTRKPKVQNALYLADLRGRLDRIYDQITQLRRIERDLEASDPDRAKSLKIKRMEQEIVAQRIWALVQEEEALPLAEEA